MRTVHSPGMVLDDGSAIENTEALSQALTEMMHVEEMVGVRSTYTYAHNAGRPVVVRMLDRAGCEVEVGISHNTSLTETTVTTISPMNGYLYFY